MQKYKILLVLFAVFCALSFAVLAARAEEAAALPVTDATAAQALAESVSLADEAETLDGVQLTEPKNIPSGFGFWWNDLKENISLALTFNPVKKAEKQLQFAAQRVKLAEYMTQNSTDTKVQEKARQLLTRANEYMEKIQERKNELAQNVNQEKVQVLLRNAAKHQVNAQRVFEELEDKLPAEKLEAWQQWRQQIEVRQQQFLEELKTDVALPQELKDKAAEIKARIEAKIQNREEFRAQQEEILDEIKAGKEEAKAALEELRKERQQLVGPAREQYQETKSEIIDKINSGDQEAVKELIQLNQARKTEVKKIQQEVKVKAVEIKTEVKNTIEENR
ncbi:hypothetical protein KJ590_03300 [Patescibacteria group bacterium]|nr:hypothetical protein [Patescibacteria group bacterium]